MADEKISAMTPAGALTGTEIVPALQVGANVRTTTQDIANLGAGSYPVWVAPAGLSLVWRNIANTADITLSDAGNIFMHTQGQFTYQNNVAIGLTTEVIADNTGWRVVAWSGTVAKLVIQGAGSVILNGTGNTLTEAGFNNCSRQYTTIFAGSWGGPGVPVDLETAMDRVAAAVAGLLGGPIP